MKKNNLLVQWNYGTAMTPFVVSLHPLVVQLFSVTGSVSYEKRIRSEDWSRIFKLNECGFVFLDPHS